MKLLPFAAAIAGITLAMLLSGCASPTPSPGGLPGSEGTEDTGVVCDFLSGATISAVVSLDSPSGWDETALSETACEWRSPDNGLAITIEVLIGRDATLASIEGPTSTAMIGPHETTVVRTAFEPELIDSAYVVAGFDYFVKMSQSPASLTDEEFSELAYPAAIEFENSPLNVG